MTDEVDGSVPRGHSPAAAGCQLCNEAVEVADQPEGAELCNSCAAYLDAKFAPLSGLLCSPDMQAVIDADENSASGGSSGEPR